MPSVTEDEQRLVQYASYHTGESNVAGEIDVDWRSVRKILDKCVQQVLSNPDSSNFWKKVSEAESLKDFLKLEQVRSLVNLLYDLLTTGRTSSCLRCL
jgi:hypothetical protein